MKILFPKSHIPGKLKKEGIKGERNKENSVNIIYDTTTPSSGQTELHTTDPAFQLFHIVFPLVNRRRGAIPEGFWEIVFTLHYQDNLSGVVENTSQNPPRFIRVSFELEALVLSQCC